jgi:tetratricopeptide (TPR) repeat protein
MPAPDLAPVSVGAADPNATRGDGPTSTVPAVAQAGTQRYALGEEIARGGMGVIYRATDTALGREVAVKVLQEKFAPDSGVARRFADEARIAAQLQHPAIPPVHDLGTLPDGRPFLAMKLIKGQTLDELLAARPDVSAERGRYVAAFEAVCQAIAYAHTHSVIHRDLKPANVMVGAFGEVQVMDWGLAKVLSARPGETDDPEATRAETLVRSLRDSDGLFTQAGSVLGTPAFMAPEQALGAVARVDARSDVFGLGAILAVILTGRPPFAAGSAETVRMLSAQGNLAECLARLDACGAEPDLVALCKRCLSPRAVDRPPDAGEVARAVAALRAAAEDRARRAERDRVAAATVKFLEERVFAVARPKGQDGGLGRDVTLRDALAASLPALATDFADQPLAEARLRMTLGASFLCLGEAEAAATQFQSARELYTDHRGPDHPDTLGSVESLAASYADLGRHAEALQFRTGVQNARKATLGHDHADTLASMSALANSYNALARHAEARELREQILSLRRLRQGADHADTLASMKDLAASYYFLGQHAEALQLREEALALRTAQLGRDNRETLQSLFDVAISYLALGRSAEALGQFEETLALREALLGPLHPDTLWSLWGVATSHAALGRHTEALPRLEQVFERRRDKLGPDHPDTLWTVWGLAKSLVALGRGAEAVSLIDECVMRHAGQIAYPRLIPGVLDVRLRYLEMRQDAAGCRQTATMWEAVSRPGAVNLYAVLGSHVETHPEGGVSCPGAALYTAARMRAVAARAFERANQPAESIADANRAMGWLTKAVAAGFGNVAHMRADSDLDALRPRQDFQQLLKELDANESDNSGQKDDARPPTGAGVAAGAR